MACMVVYKIVGFEVIAGIYGAESNRERGVSRVCQCAKSLKVPPQNSMQKTLVLFDWV